MIDINTLSRTKIRAPGLKLRALIIANVTLMSVSCATAQTPSASYAVQSTPNQYISLGVKAFKKADYELAVSYNKRALKLGMSPARKAIAHSNLCAAYGALENYDEASANCKAALALFPETRNAKENLARVNARIEQAS